MIPNLRVAQDGDPGKGHPCYTVITRVLGWGLNAFAVGFAGCWTVLA
jgi:hypothetical protein